MGDSESVADVEEPSDDSWFDGIISGIADFFGGVFEGMAMAIKSIASGLADLTEGIKNTILSVIDKITTTASDIINSIVDLPRLMVEKFNELLTYLFIPSENYFDDLYQKFVDKFPLIDDVKTLVVDFFEFATGTKGPNWKVTVAGLELDIINWSMFATVRLFIHAIIIAIAYYRFSQWVISYLPRLIRGL